MVKVLKSGNEDFTEISITGLEKNNEVARRMIEEAIEGTGSDKFGGFRGGMYVMVTC